MRFLLLLLLAGCAAPRALWLGGDVHLGNGGAERLEAIGGAMAPVKGVVNLEGPVGSAEDARASTTAKLVNGPQAAAALLAAGVIAAGVENNHAEDLPRAALAGLPTFGVTVIEVGGLNVALTAHDLKNGVPPSLKAELIAARTGASALVATFHVTGPSSYLPGPALTEAVEIALDAGATVIAAHGTHVIANVERRGRAVIAWGLGNLTFDCACTNETDGLILAVDFAADGAVAKAQAIPVDAGLRGANATLARDPGFTMNLLMSLGAKPSRRLGDRLEF